MIWTLSRAISEMWSPGLSTASRIRSIASSISGVLLVPVDEAAGDDLGPADELVGLLVDL